MLCNCLEAVAARGAGWERTGQDCRKTILKQPWKLLRDPTDDVRMENREDVIQEVAL